jgi:hypothetical protein
VCAVNGCSTDATAFDDSKPWTGCCGRLADDKAEEVFESPESTDVLAEFADWLEDGSSLAPV